MKNLFDQDPYNEVMQRINKLKPESERTWGKMDVAQMLAHCKAAFKVPLSDKPIPRSFLGLLIGWMIRKKLYNEEPWKQNLPTAPGFKIKEERNFETEKTELVALVSKFHQSSPAAIEKIVHPMFGRYTGEQWGKAMYKHLNHHLTQFGV